MTQAGRARAATVVIVCGDEATIRREGRDEHTIPLAEVVATLSK
jgi:hypothetical protein